MKGIKIAVICDWPVNSSSRPMPPFFKNGGFFTPSFSVRKTSRTCARCRSKDSSEYINRAEGAGQVHLPQRSVMPP